MNGGDVSSSHASGAVGGFYPGDGYTAGGLIGVNGGSVTSSYATGAVSGQTSVGGLAGENYGTLSATFATGTVSGSNDVGGLVGNNGGTVRFSFATGATTGADDVGGLVGGNGGRVENSYATGSASGTGQYVGGLVGLNGPTAAIWASYATGAATGRTVGGLVGLSQGTIDQAYATGRVTGLGDGAGGLVGRTMVGVVSASYWDKDGTGLNAGCGNLSDCATDLTSTEAATPGSYADFDFANTWYHGPGATPILYASPFVLRVAADNQTMTAGGPVPVLTATYQNLWAGDTGAIVSGLGTTATSSSSPGTYAITGDGLSAISTTGQAYKIIYTPGTLTVVPRPASAATTVGTIQRQILGGTSPEARLRQAASLGAWHSGAPQPGELKLAVAPELKATIPGTSGLAGPEQATE